MNAPATQNDLGIEPQVEHHQQELMPRNDINPMTLVDKALSQNADIETLTRLMDLQERWEKGEARKAFVEAMNQFKADPPTIRKNKHVKYENRDKSVTEYDHATLDNICEVIGAALSKVGISFRWQTQQLEGGWISVTCVLTHERGHSEQTTLQGPPDQSGGKNAIQAIGSTTEYLRRYTLLAITGLAVAGMDDDGQGGAGSDQGQKKTEDGPKPTADSISEEDRQLLIQEATKGGYTEADICRMAHVRYLIELPKTRLGAALNHLRNMRPKGA